MILGIDIGGTDTKMAVGDGQGHLYDKIVFSNNYDSYRTPILRTVIEHVEDYLNHTAYSIQGIGVSATGQIDPITGTVVGTNGTIPAYEGTCFKTALEDRFNLKTEVLNDANAAALGETLVGAGRGCRNAVMVTIGTGVGGGIIVDGKVFGGSHGLAGEIGQCFFGANHMDPSERFEANASTSALVNMVGKVLDRSSTSLDGRAVFDLAEKRDQRVLSALDLWMDSITVGLVNLIYIFDPETVIIGGGVSEQRSLFIDPLTKKVLNALPSSFQNGLKIEAATLGNTAGIHGAVMNYLSSEI